MTFLQDFSCGQLIFDIALLSNILVTGGMTIWGLRFGSSDVSVLCGFSLLLTLASAGTLWSSFVLAAKKFGKVELKMAVKAKLGATILACACMFLNLLWIFWCGVALVLQQEYILGRCLPVFPTCESVEESNTFGLNGLMVLLFFNSYFSDGSSSPKGVRNYVA